MTTFREDTTVRRTLLRNRKTRGRKITDLVLADDGQADAGRVATKPGRRSRHAPMGSLADRERPVGQPMATRDES